MSRFSFLFIFLLLFVGCAGSRDYQPSFDHQIIKQIGVENPSFMIITENDRRNYRDQIEDAFINNNLSVISSESQIVTTDSRGRVIGSTLTNRGSAGIAGGRFDESTTHRILDISNTSATALFVADCHTWVFKVIKIDTRELIMKGYLCNDFDTEIKEIIRQLTGK